MTRDRAKDGRNWYLYCDGNPLRFLDSGGSEIKIVGFSSKMRRKVQKQLQQVRRVFPHILDFEEHVNPHLLSDGGGQTLRIKWMRT
ncbi:MAG: hypothetical protein HYR64_06120 [Fimbriimonas ginsengisoli]|uniref:RHS repeat-associated core domain-containing protein n=1 Tax=Fimbriimonas ginsengisoli TaxID=1005039 RepID=A0A931LVW9_FIMGI|nr:hypothetical protein [Fimbriimonas ginsengisoli]